AVLSATMLLCLMTAAHASVMGDLKTSSGNGTVTVTIGSITFNPNTAGQPSSGPWNGEVTNTTFLTFAGCPTGALGTPGCLDAPPFDTAEAVEFANNNPIILGAGLAANNPFIQFAGNGVTHTAIDYFITGAGPGSSNTNCQNLTPGES